MPNDRRNSPGIDKRKKPGPDPVFTERVQLQVTKEQWRRMKLLCEALGVSMSAVVRQGIDDLIERVEGQLDAEEG